MNDRKIETFDNPWPFAPGKNEPARVLEDFPEGGRVGDGRPYHIGTIEDVPLKNTPLGPLMEALAKVYPVPAARLHFHYDHVVRPRVREAHRAFESGARDLANRNAERTRWNEPLLKQITALEASLQALVVARAKELKTNSDERVEGLMSCAEAQAKACRPFDGKKVIPEAGDPARQRSEAAHAANLNLPVTASEESWFIPPKFEWVLSLIAGGIAGLSYFAAAQIVHLDSLPHEWTLALAGVATGGTLTLYAGFCVKNCWRFVGKAFHAGAVWIGRAIVAAIVTLACISVEVAIVMRGILASSSIHMKTAALSGQTGPSGATDALTGLLLGGAMSIAYFGYAAIRGFLAEQIALENRIAAAREAERITLIAGERKSEAWVAALEKSNRVAALDAAAESSAAAFEAEHNLLSAALNNLYGRLRTLDTVPSPLYQARMRAARYEAEGQQAEFNRGLEALIEGRPWISEFSASRQQTHWERLKAAYGPECRCKEGE